MTEITTIKRTPISYYGGKQMMAKEIIPKIPPHLRYVEPFFGGGAVFFTKERSPIEVINDMNSEVFNFYNQVKFNFEQLQIMVQNTLHSRQAHKKAGVIYDNPDLFSDTERAWAFWVQTNMSFGCQIQGGFGYDLKGSTGLKLMNKRHHFTEALNVRLALVEIENNDALKVIQRRDSPDTFIYADPPYVGSDMGHYKGYTMADFIGLLDQLAKGKSKFLLSSYPSDELDDYVKRYGWQTERYEKSLSAAPTHGTARKKKVEVLTWNY